MAHPLLINLKATVFLGEEYLNPWNYYLSTKLYKICF